MAGQAEHPGARLTFGRDLMRGYLLAMSDADRRAFAERLESRMRGGVRDDEGEGKDTDRD